MEGYTHYEQLNLEQEVDEMFDRVDEISLQIVSGIINKMRRTPNHCYAIELAIDEAILDSPQQAS